MMLSATCSPFDDLPVSTGAGDKFWHRFRFGGHHGWVNGVLLYCVALKKSSIIVQQAGKKSA
jgi:hypothetical protein